MGIGGNMYTVHTYIYTYRVQNYVHVEPTS